VLEISEECFQVDGYTGLRFIKFFLRFWSLEFKQVLDLHQVLY
jgi:hypothetical protein